jgi:hypothetical protein
MNLAPEWRRLCDENAELRAEIERLTQERDQFIEQIALRQPSAVERGMQEIMRINNELRAELALANTLILAARAWMAGEFIPQQSWHRDADKWVSRRSLEGK